MTFRDTLASILLGIIARFKQKFVLLHPHESGLVAQRLEQ